MRLSGNQRGGVTINTILILMVLVGLAYFWQSSSDKQKEIAAELDEFTYVSPGGEFQLTVPTDWVVGENTVEGEDGVVIIELQGPQNSIVNKAYAEQEGVESESIEDAIINERFDELISSSVGKEFVLLQFEIVTSAFYEIPESKEGWRNQLQDSVSVAEGVAYGEFNDFEIEGGDGYKYSVTLFEENGQLESVAYYILGDYAEADILVYPATSNYAQAAEDIIKSLKILTVPEDSEV